MKLIVGAQLSPALADELRKAGCNAVAVREIGLRDAKDSVIWDYALKHGVAIITKDEDFAERCLHTANPPLVVWLRIGNATNPMLFRWFLPTLPTVLTRLAAGDKLIEVR